MELFGKKIEQPITSDVGFQPEVIPEGVPESELVYFFMEHLSMPKPDNVSEEYYRAEFMYYLTQAKRVLEALKDEEQRERLRKFLNHE